MYLNETSNVHSFTCLVRKYSYRKGELELSKIVLDKRVMDTRREDSSTVDAQLRNHL
jgi:hypothetical protein